MTQEFRPYLPGVLAFIADEISDKLAVRLAELKGGREVYIPKNPGPETSLAKLVGLENARLLYEHLGSGKLLVPAGNIGGQTGRRQRVAMLLDQGLSHSEIAAEVDVHLRTVERVAASLRDPESKNQGDFFL
ncbi:helix-turn-helix domain-containing protein [Pseudophaeobacter arcticus]|jgi:hypothetical protein|uniref:helix-turn-helix domain-containing protein n=1 Tax=Pseudophaeobacter arcticus TaxID=385492 RepID=UPI0004037423|nr:helix-turn-helix domain-containing protein [Pseudophaeobacter arcticus]